MILAEDAANVRIANISQLITRIERSSGWLAKGERHKRELLDAVQGLRSALERETHVPIAFAMLQGIVAQLASGPLRALLLTTTDDLRGALTTAGFPV